MILYNNHYCFAKHIVHMSKPNAHSAASAIRQISMKQIIQPSFLQKSEEINRILVFYLFFSILFFCYYGPKQKSRKNDFEMSYVKQRHA